MKSSSSSYQEALARERNRAPHHYLSQFDDALHDLQVNSTLKQRLKSRRQRNGKKAPSLRHPKPWKAGAVHHPYSTYKGDSSLLLSSNETIPLAPEKPEEKPSGVFVRPSEFIQYVCIVSSSTVCLNSSSVFSLGLSQFLS